MAKATEQCKTATIKYMKENCREYKFRLNKTTEPELYEYFEAIANKQGYLKELILADMRAKQTEST